MDNGLTREMLSEVLSAGPSLFELDELEDFVFEIDLEDPDIIEYTKLYNERFDNNSKDVQQRLLKVMPVLSKKLFVPEKQKELSDILGEIERNYKKQDQNISLIARMSKFALEDDETRCEAPIVIAKVIYEIELAYHGKLQFKIEQAEKLVSDGNTEGAVTLLTELKGIGRMLWEVPEKLAYMYWKSGNKEKAIAEIKEALRIAGIHWKRTASGMKYEIIEQLEKITDEYLGRPEKEILARFADYAYGMLYDAGAAELDDVISNLDATAVLPAFITRTVFEDALAKDDRFKMKDDYLYLSAIDNIDLLLSERKQRKIEFAYFRYELSAMKLIQEGRMKELFSEDELFADNELREMTGGKWNLVSVRRRMRTDVTGKPNNLDNVIASVGEVNGRKRIAQLLTAVWKYSPRWELGGMMPAEYAPETKDKNKKPAAHSHGDNCSCGHDH
ncbi:MAG: hypothetical protein HZA48_07950 [Planctomycetes bacterium]|nr:hypothetical protein [Planctomycetota bacterium]